jgi:hypothetical protein
LSNAVVLLAGSDYEHRLRQWLSLEDTRKFISVDHVVEPSASASLTTRDRSPSKDI